MTTNVLLLGAGKIGETIAAILSQSGDYHLTVADTSEVRLNSLKQHAKNTVVADISNAAVLDTLTAGHQAVLSACP